MTEAEWLTAMGPSPMLLFVEDVARARKHSLIECACCRRIEHLVPLPAFGRAIGTTERFADGRASIQEFRAARDVMAAAFALPDPPLSSRAEAYRFLFSSEENKYRNHVLDCAALASVPPAERWVRFARGIAHAQQTGRLPGDFDLSTWVPFSDLPIQAVVTKISHETYDQMTAGEKRAQADIVRDVYGNPFRPVTFAPEWRTDTALALARTMYDAREFGAMPILADALQDAGCANDDILTHCREPGTHVRGCWVCDLVLGKV